MVGVRENIMKTRIALILIACIAAVNCAKKGNSNPGAAQEEATGITPGAPIIPDPTGPFVPPATGPGQNPGTGFLWGGTSDFVFENVSTYREYTQRYITNLAQLSNVKINLNFDRYDTSYGGTVTIRYLFNGQEYEGFFTGGHSASATRYNIWFQNLGNNVWHGFFEDFMGGIVVVLDGTASLADGVQPTDTVSGSVWFKNFDPSWDHPSTYCWFVVGGPYDCRTWKKDGAVQTKQAVYPLAKDGYQKLGSFTGLNVLDAFNDDLVLP
jgi:hypothetical protein